MTHPVVSVTNIPQLQDNYSYAIKTNNTNEVIIVDPAESKKIMKYIKKKSTYTNRYFAYTPSQ